MSQKIKKIWRIMVEEWRTILCQPLYLLLMLGAPIFISYFFLDLMKAGAPDELPVVVVDKDGSKTSRNITRNLDAFKNTRIVLHAKDFHEAERAVQKGEAYGIYMIPENFEKDLMASRQPTLSFYTNNSVLIPASLQMSDMTTISALASGSVGRSIMLAKGATEEQTKALLQPISVDTHAISNHNTNYAVYLCPVLLPGIYNILVVLLTLYVLGMEVKYGLSRQLLRLADGNIMLAMAAKLLPMTVIFCIVCMAMNSVMFGILGFPCHCGLAAMNLTSCLMVIANQCVAIFLYGLFPIMRLSLSIASIYSVLGLSLSGFTFPVSAFPQIFQAWPYVCPIRQYFLIYSEQALNGFGWYYSWHYLVGMALFGLLPLLVMPRIKKIYEAMVYEP
ncbi:MAG: ABC transporter permease [Paludibacteraceae bacterium]|nr:ABC transporter permease [Paludibacteraceae bacterium]MBP3717300.1 ABC transporter permease [Paludibacteraceae bacterium]